MLFVEYSKCGTCKKAKTGLPIRTAQSKRRIRRRKSFGLGIK